MTFEEMFLELLKWIGGGGVALLGLWLTKRQHSSDNKFSIVHELQEENKRKDSRLDKQDEKIQFLTDQMDDMRVEMFKIQSDKHRSEVKNVELQSTNDRLERENSELAQEIQVVQLERNELAIQLDTEVEKIRDELNERMDRLIKENEDLRIQVIKLGQRD